MPVNSYHYDVISRAIRIIDDSPSRNISLAELAAGMNMSTSHFQRIFSHWAGISPKKYQQYLRLDHARSLLRNKMPVLDTSRSLGLSGASRLHDLFLNWEAMTPGEYASGGEGLEISHGIFDSPFGSMLAMGTGKGLCGIAFTSETGEEAALADLVSRWPNADFRHHPDAIGHWVSALNSQTGDTRMLVGGGPFQIKVWEALLEIPPGSTVTYTDIAHAIGHPRATRAAATAIGKNPLAWLIPCHRVIRKSGELGGYHWGLPVKRAMLAREAARCESSQVA